MAKKKKQEEAPAGSPAWMATFSDLMNLLLCFFVLLFSMSSVDAEKFEQVVASLSNTFSIFNGGGSAIGEGQLISNGMSQLNDLSEYFSEMGMATDGETEDITDSAMEELQAQQQETTEILYEELKSLEEKYNIGDYTEFTMDSNFEYVQISLSGAVLFDSAEATIKKEAIPILNKVGDILKIYDKYQIKIEGHTDNVPIYNSIYKTNMELSTARACNVYEYLVTTKKLDPLTLEAAGKSEYHPVADNKTAEGRAKNRRVEIKIYNTLFN